MKGEASERVLRFSEGKGDAVVETHGENLLVGEGLDKHGIDGM